MFSCMYNNISFSCCIDEYRDEIAVMFNDKIASLSTKASEIQALLNLNHVKNLNFSYKSQSYEVRCCLHFAYQLFSSKIHFLFHACVFRLII